MTDGNKTPLTVDDIRFGKALKPSILYLLSKPPVMLFSALVLAFLAMYLIGDFKIGKCEIDGQIFFGIYFVLFGLVMTSYLIFALQKCFQEDRQFVKSIRGWILIFILAGFTCLPASLAYFAFKEIVLPQIDCSPQ